MSGSQGFASPNLVLSDASPTGNINTSTMFDLQDWSSTHNSIGIFAGMPVQDFGNVMLNDAVGTGLKFGDTLFGTFSSTTITATSTGPGFLDVLATGMFAPGTISPGSPAATAEVRIALTQTPPATGEISASGTMSLMPTTVVPEPPTFLLMLGGFALIGLILSQNPKMCDMIKKP